MSGKRQPPLAARVALYARVSSEKQAEEGTIASQVAALQERVEADGYVVDPAYRFIDDGVSGTTLVRPALERLRDLAATGAIDRLYVLAPDRLARRLCHQMVLLEELQAYGVAVVFVNRPLGTTPEDQLLLQMQGVIAEYEHAKLLERTRRGRRQAARLRQRPGQGPLWLSLYRQEQRRRRGAFPGDRGRGRRGAADLSLGRPGGLFAAGSGPAAAAARGADADRSLPLGLRDDRGHAA
jgi:DNA invertase Pin-like site-specific DNA recombinase